MHENDDEEEFDAYLQEYIDMYTNAPRTSNEPSYETRLEDIIASETLDVVDSIDQQDIVLRCRADSNYKRKHQNHSNNQPTETSSSSDSSPSVPIKGSKKCHRSNSTKQQAERENLLEFYESQLRLIRTYSLVSANRCKLFSLDDEARLKQERKIRKIQRAIKLLRRINLQNHTGSVHMWESAEDNDGTVCQKKTSIKRDKDTKSLLKLLFLNPETSESIVRDEEKTTTAEEATTASGLDMETSESLSLIEQIRLKAQFLRETKLIDKVSIASSNFDEYNAHDFNTNEIDKEDTLELMEHNSNKNQLLQERRKRDSFKKSFLLSSSISGTPSSMGSSSSLLSIERGGRQMCSAGKSTSSSIYFDQEENKEEESERDGSVSCTEPDSVATTVTAMAAMEAGTVAENDMFDTLSLSSASSMSSSSFSSLIGIYYLRVIPCKNHSNFGLSVPDSDFQIRKILGS